VRAATLLVVGGDDQVVIQLNEAALRQLGAAVKELAIIPGASHLFEEPGALEEVAHLAADWFCRYLTGKPREVTGGEEHATSFFEHRIAGRDEGITRQGRSEGPSAA
jgi:hypothetical protein